MMKDWKILAGLLVAVVLIGILLIAIMPKNDSVESDSGSSETITTPSDNFGGIK